MANDGVAVGAASLQQAKKQTALGKSRMSKYVKDRLCVAVFCSAPFTSMYVEALHPNVLNRHLTTWSTRRLWDYVSDPHGQLQA